MFKITQNHACYCSLSQLEVSTNQFMPHGSPHLISKQRILKAQKPGDKIT